jgi:hypothetical protein
MKGKSKTDCSVCGRTITSYPRYESVKVYDEGVLVLFIKHACKKCGDIVHRRVMSNVK